jgi:hypothetical protein
MDQGLNGKEDGDAILWSTGGNIRQLCASGHHCQCCLHCPGHLYEATEAEKGGGGSSRTVVSALEQCPSAHCCLFVQVAGKAQHPGALSPSLFTNIAHADFFLFPKVKNHLDDITLTQDTLKSTWERAIRTLNTKEFAAAYRR